MISRNVFLQEMKRLELNFGVELAEDRFAFFHDRLSANRFTDDNFPAIVEKVLCNERFFPTFAVFLAYNPKREVAI